MLTGSWIVRLLGKTGSDRRTVKVTRMTQCMVRPCVARRFRRAGGKRSCINVSGLWLEAVLRAIMDISAPATSLAERPLGAIWVTSVRTRREDRTSISCYPLADLGG